MLRNVSKTVLFQWVDATLGWFVCAVFTIFRKATGLFWKPGARGNTERKGLLFIKLAEQGSTVLAAPALQDAVVRHGRENVYFLVFEENRFILEALRIVDGRNILTIRTGGALQLVFSGLRRLHQIRSMKLRECVDMEFFAKFTAAFSWLTGIPVRVGFHSWFSEGPWRGDLLTHRVRYNPHLHTSATFRGLVAAAGADPAAFPRFDWIPPSMEVLPLPVFQATEAEEMAIANLLRECTGSGPEESRELVLLNANASDLLPLRRWADENYVRLAQRLLEGRKNLFIGFTGGPEEAEKIQKLVDAVGSPRVFRTAGRTTLRELMQLYRKADVLVTNDSGPAHFAALTEIHTVVLFGPETPALFGSLSPRAISLSSGIACSPCVSALNNRQTACTNNLCMQKIEVDVVYETVLRVLKSRRG